MLFHLFAPMLCDNEKIIIARKHQRLKAMLDTPKFFVHALMS